MTTDLCKLAYKYGTDKCPQLKHSYTPFYYQLLKSKRQKIKKILEMDIIEIITWEQVYICGEIFSQMLNYGQLPNKLIIARLY